MSDGTPQAGDFVTANVRLASPLGAGGMGAVWSAEHLGLETEVVVKFMLGSSTTRPEAAASFRREAAAAARVRSPFVVRMHDFGVTREGTPFIVMERLHGRDLSQELAARGRLSIEETLAVVGPLSEALDAAHAVGIVHRDLKGANVFLCDEPGGARTVKLLDFGIAKWLDDTTERAARPGALVGTPFAMSPEQLEGRSDLDAASDLWSLGVLVFEALTGRRPFDATAFGALLMQILSDPLPVPSRVEPSLSAAVDAWFSRACERDRGRRFGSAGEAFRALESAALGGRTSGSRTATHRRLAALPRPGTDFAESAPASDGHLARTWSASGTEEGPTQRDPTEAFARTLAASAVEPAARRLPAESNAFVGRSDELSWLARTFFDEGARVVTLLGLGGAGKSRLATRFAGSSRQRWPGGAVRCDLLDARDEPDDVARAVAVALEVPLGRAPIEQVGYALRGRADSLLVLDSAERSRASVVRCLTRWLELAPNVRFLLTSRERVDAPSERRLSLEPLDRPSAIALFSARAQAVRANVEHDEQTLEALVDLLDRLPLAIELAAARTSVLTPARLLERMRERFKLLTSNARAGRQSTLRAVLDGSWELLRDGERQALAQLSVFHGGFTLEAAERVLRLEDLWPVDAVRSLVDKSLLIPSGRRFTMLQSVHAYASERLAATTEAAQAEGRHEAYFSALGSIESLGALHRHGGKARREALALELDNVLAAVERALARGATESAALGALAAWAVYDAHGPFEPGRALLARVHERLGPEGALAGRVLHALAHAVDSLGDAKAAAKVFADAIDALRVAGDERALIDALQRSAVATLTAGDLDLADARLREALERARSIDDPLGACRTLMQQGQLLLYTGRLDEAMEHLGDALSVARSIGSRWVECAGLSALGSTRWIRSRAPETIEDFHRALSIAREEGFRKLQTSLLINLGEVERERGQIRAARQALEEGLVVALETGEARSVGTAQAELASLEHQEGHRARALERWAEAEQQLRSLGDEFQRCLLLASRSACEAPHDRARAEQDVAEAERIADALGFEPGGEAAQRIRVARDALAR
jgi:serine/threonine protein kinase/predicted ATPase